MSSPAPARQRFSHSRLSTLSDCPRRYRYRYVERLKEGFRTVEAFVGTLVHDALGWLYTEREERREPGADELVERFRADWERRLRPDVKVVKAGRTTGEYRREGEEMLRGHHGVAFAADRHETVAIEPRVDVEIRGASFMGYIDRLARDPESGTLRVIDYKTGRRMPDDFEEAALQVQGYGLAVLEEHGGSEVELEYHYLRHRLSLAGTLIRQETPAVAERLGTLIDEALEAERAGDFPPSPGPLCAWCGFREICDVSGYASAGEGGATGGCPRCGSPLRLRQGRHGAFLGCTAFPSCRFSRDATDRELE